MGDPSPDHEMPSQRADARVTLAPCLVAGAAVGAVAGLVELAEMAVRRWMLGDLLYVSNHVLWIVPATYVLLAALVGSVGGLLSRFSGSRVGTRSVLAPMVFVACFGVISVWHPRIHFLAILVLAAGLTFPVTEWVQRWMSSRGWKTRRIVLGVVTLLLVGALGTWVAGFGGRVYEAAPTNDGRAGQSDNVVLVVWDTVRKISVGRVPGASSSLTPNLDRLATRGVTFTDAVSTSSWTLPAHASLFTGHLPFETSAGWRTPLDGELPTLAEVLTSDGYATGGFVANLIYGTRVHGLSRGFSHWEDYRLSWGEAVLSSALGRLVGNSSALRRFTGYHDILGRSTATDITDAFLDWQSDLEDRPFFAFLNYFDAHEPYLPPPPYDTLVQHGVPRRTDLIRLWDREGTVIGKQRMSDEEMQIEQSAYQASIAYLDAQLGRLLDSLEARGVLSRTLVIVTSDHGEQFGERGAFTHGNSLYPEATDVPLVVAGRGVPTGTHVSEPVSLRDLTSTILTAVDSSRTTHFPGKPLQTHWNSDPPTDDLVISQLRDDGVTNPWNGAVSSITTVSHLLIENGDGSFEVFERENGLVTRKVPADRATSIRDDLLRRRDLASH